MPSSNGVRVRQVNLAEREMFNGATLMVDIDVATALTETTAETEQVINLFDVLAGDMVEFVGGHLLIPVEDASDAAFNSTALELGYGTNDDQFLAATQLNENGTEILYIAPALGAFAFAAADTVDATFGSMAAKSLSNIDVGRVVVGFRVTRLPLLAGKLLFD